MEKYKSERCKRGKTHGKYFGKFDAEIVKIAKDNRSIADEKDTNLETAYPGMPKNPPFPFNADDLTAEDKIEPPEFPTTNEILLHHYVYEQNLFKNAELWLDKKTKGAYFRDDLSKMFFPRHYPGCDSAQWMKDCYHLARIRPCMAYYVHLHPTRGLDLDDSYLLQRNADPNGTLVEFWDGSMCYVQRDDTGSAPQWVVIAVKSNKDDGEPWETPLRSSHPFYSLYYSRNWQWQYERKMFANVIEIKELSQYSNMSSYKGIFIDTQECVENHNVIEMRDKLSDILPVSSTPHLFGLGIQSARSIMDCHVFEPGQSCISQSCPYKPLKPMDSETFRAHWYLYHKGFHTIYLCNLADKEGNRCRYYAGLDCRPMHQHLAHCHSEVDIEESLYNWCYTLVRVNPLPDGNVDIMRTAQKDWVWLDKTVTDPRWDVPQQSRYALPLPYSTEWIEKYQKISERSKKLKKEECIERRSKILTIKSSISSQKRASEENKIGAKKVKRNKTEEVETSKDPEHGTVSKKKAVTTPTKTKSSNSATHNSLDSQECDNKEEKLRKERNKTSTRQIIDTSHGRKRSIVEKEDFISEKQREHDRKAILEESDDDALEPDTDILDTDQIGGMTNDEKAQIHFFTNFLKMKVKANCNVEKAYNDPELGKINWIKNYHKMKNRNKSGAVTALLYQKMYDLGWNVFAPEVKHKLVSIRKAVMESFDRHLRRLFEDQGKIKKNINGSENVSRELRVVIRRLSQKEIERQMKNVEFSPERAMQNRKIPLLVNSKNISQIGQLKKKDTKKSVSPKDKSKGSKYQGKSRLCFAANELKTKAKTQVKPKCTAKKHTYHRKPHLKSQETPCKDDSVNQEQLQHSSSDMDEMNTPEQRNVKNGIQRTSSGKDETSRCPSPEPGEVDSTMNHESTHRHYSRDEIIATLIEILKKPALQNVDSPQQHIFRQIEMGSRALVEKYNELARHYNELSKLYQIKTSSLHEIEKEKFSLKGQLDLLRGLYEESQEKTKQLNEEITNKATMIRDLNITLNSKSSVNYGGQMKQLKEESGDLENITHLKKQLFDTNTELQLTRMDVEYQANEVRKLKEREKQMQEEINRYKAQNELLKERNAKLECDNEEKRLSSNDNAMMVIQHENDIRKLKAEIQILKN